MTDPDRPSARPAGRLLRLPGGAARGQGRAWSATCSRGSRARYDLMNDLMSGGVHRLWKAALIDWLAPRPGMRLLDVAGGTGDIAFRVLRPGRQRRGAALGSLVCDINPRDARGRPRPGARREPARRHRLAVRRRRGAAAAATQRRRLHDRLRHPQRHPDRPRAGRGAARAAGRAAGSSAWSSRTVRAAGAATALYDAYSFNVVPWLGQQRRRRPGGLPVPGREHPPLPRPGDLRAADRARPGSSRCAIATCPAASRRSTRAGGSRHAPCCATLRHLWRADRHRRAASPATTRCSRSSCCRCREPVLRLARRLSRQDAPGRPGQRLARALQELGPSFIKLGQSLATRADLLGEELAADCRSCRTTCRRSGARGPPADRGASSAGRSTSCSRASTTGRSPRPRSPRCISRVTTDGRGGRGQGAAARASSGDRARPRLLRLARDLGRAPAARLRRLRPVEVVRDLRRSGPGSRWICAWRPRPPPSSPRTSPATRASACRGSTGSAPRAAC